MTIVGNFMLMLDKSKDNLGPITQVCESLTSEKMAQNPKQEIIFKLKESQELINSLERQQKDLLRSLKKY